MGKLIIKIKDRYFEWSTVSDSPTTYGMTLDKLREYIKEEYGNVGLEQLPARLERVEKYGTSSYDYESATKLCAHNRAGENEKHISLEQIYKRYAWPPEN